MASIPHWTLPSTIRWWAPARGADGPPCADDVQTALLIHRWMVRNAPLGSIEAAWVAAPPRRRGSAAPGLARQTDGRPGEVRCTIGVRSSGVTPGATAQALDAFEEAIGTIFEVGSHDARRSDAPSLPETVHPVAILMAPTGEPETIERLSELPDHLARMAIRAGRLSLHARVSPPLDSAAVLPKVDETQRAMIARDRHRHRAPRTTTMLRSRVLRNLGDTVLLSMALRADRPLDAASRLTIEHLLTESLGSPVEVREPTVDVHAIPADGEFAATLMGTALHAFSGARRPSAARMRHLRDEYPQTSPHRRATEAPVLGEDEEG